MMRIAFVVLIALMACGKKNIKGGSASLATAATGGQGQLNDSGSGAASGSAEEIDKKSPIEVAFSIMRKSACMEYDENYTAFKNVMSADLEAGAKLQNEPCSTDKASGRCTITMTNNNASNAIAGTTSIVYYVAATNPELVQKAEQESCVAPNPADRAEYIKY